MLYACYSQLGDECRLFMAAGGCPALQSSRSAAIYRPFCMHVLMVERGCHGGYMVTGSSARIAVLQVWIKHGRAYMMHECSTTDDRPLGREPECTTCILASWRLIECTYAYMHVAGSGAVLCYPHQEEDACVSIYLHIVHWWPTSFLPMPCTSQQNSIINSYLPP